MRWEFYKRKDWIKFENEMREKYWNKNEKHIIYIKKNVTRMTHRQRERDENVFVFINKFCLITKKVMKQREINKYYYCILYLSVIENELTQRVYSNKLEKNSKKMMLSYFVINMQQIISVNANKLIMLQNAKQAFSNKKKNVFWFVKFVSLKLIKIKFKNQNFNK